MWTDQKKNPRPCPSYTTNKNIVMVRSTLTVATTTVTVYSFHVVVMMNPTAFFLIANERTYFLTLSFVRKLHLGELIFHQPSGSEVQSQDRKSVV